MALNQFWRRGTSIWQNGVSDLTAKIVYLLVNRTRDLYRNIRGYKPSSPRVMLDQERDDERKR